MDKNNKSSQGPLQITALIGFIFTAASVVFSNLSILNLPGLILCIIAYPKCKRQNDETGKALSLSGIFIASASIVLSIISIFIIIGSMIAYIAFICLMLYLGGIA